MTRDDDNYIHETNRNLRRARADADEQRSAELVKRMGAAGIKAESGARYGDTHLAIRFDEVERLLVLLDRTPGDNRDAFKPRAPEQPYEFSAVDEPEIRGKR